MISNTKEIIDSRDVISELEELESDRETLVEAVEGAEEALSEIKDAGEDTGGAEEDLQEARAALEEWDDENGEYLEALRALNEAGESATSEWIHGETMIHDDYFVEYAKQICEDCGDVPRDLPWYIADNIDWEAVAEAIQSDYTDLDFDGETYWVRA